MEIFTGVAVDLSNQQRIQLVREKSNLKIGRENYPKTVTCDRDLSASHVISFSM